ncbi:MAG: phosphoglycerate kinase [Candidatus Aminicenantes bacterium]|jgi:phosphoglycerate kinase
MLQLKDLYLNEKTVFLRVDFNVPFNEEGQISDDTRIRAALPTLSYLLEQKAKVVCASHLGRPKGQFNPKLSMKPVAERLSQLITEDVVIAPDVIGEDVDTLKKSLKKKQVLFLENLRFYKGEKTNDPEFAQNLAKGIDYFVNDAFGACHRAHASIVGIPQYVKKSASGLLVTEELEYLNRVVYSPQKPYTAILGGAKVSDKIPVLENLLNKADNVLIGGAMAYTFFAAMGYDVGRSLVEEDKKDLALQILENSKDKNMHVQLPRDHIVAAAVAAGKETKVLDDFPIPPSMMGLDIGPKTIQAYASVIAEAKTILWNGPMGVFEIEDFSRGTVEIAEAVANSNAMSIIGGGDLVAAVAKAGVSDRISHISTGGGASLEYIAYETLPGIEALSEKNNDND